MGKLIPEFFGFSSGEIKLLLMNIPYGLAKES
jgi:hypothetical protein